MNTAAVRANRRRLLILAFLVLLCAAGYMLVEVNFSNPKLLAYAMKIRTPKLIVMLITAFAIGGASIVFQSIINNTIIMRASWSAKPSMRYRQRWRGAVPGKALPKRMLPQG